MIGVGEYARAVDGVVFVFGIEDEKFQAVFIDRDEEREFATDQLAHWAAMPGEQVKEGEPVWGAGGGSKVETPKTF
ncbi:hypothetical protein QCM80_30200 [Bradyrhizobium sp. SSUT112]|uniref:hypothetical protein n=1 Tax=Bradyrhizobium sp. SSUT112 TaxID=3040604 RepID=UPI002448678F|nr:hypothetical protein [Bradyrhizobium sp. SSUT112]MDH2354908.1 hypothetical protein [Bradyrhizobium sp. SSUT112]